MRLLWFLLFCIPMAHAKLLVLIIASDHLPVYVELQKIWKSYMHLDPEQVEAYFLRADPNLPTLVAIDGDVIWAKTSEGWSPDNAGIINKTVLTFEAMLPRMSEFDYVLRTNLSSFYVFPRLLKSLEYLPKNKCYYASGTDSVSTVGTGCGFILSRDLVELIVEHKFEFLDRATPQDDNLIAEFLNKHDIHLTLHPRLDLLSILDWQKNRSSIPEHLFHFRVKSEPNRLKDDIYIHSQLLNLFYPNHKRLSTS